MTYPIFPHRFISKLIAICLIVFINSTSASAQLRIYQGLLQTGTFGDCVVSTIYKGATIPSSLDNQISSFVLQKGYMATLAENEDGSGNSYPFMAVATDLTVNLNTALNDKVSFLRVLPIMNTLKKGAGYQDNTVIDKLNVSWFYDWGPNDVSTSAKEYALMSWGAGGASQTNVNNYIAKTGINHLLSFNEPDNTDQSNILYTAAVPLHEDLAATGYRLGSPATTEGEAQTGKWLGNFMALANTNNVRVDYVAIHWYDWGSWGSTGNTTPDPNGVFSRFKTYVNNIYNLYSKPIWITEFNANRNTTSQTHIDFMALAIPWLESQSFVERYAYFFPPALPPIDANGKLTAIGTAYKNFTSTPSIKTNLDGTSDITSYEAEDATLTDINSLINCSSGSGGKIVPAITSTQKVTFNNVSVAANTNYKLKIFYYSKATAKNITVKVNGNSTTTIALPGTTYWCYESGSSAGRYETTIALNSGNNTIEFSEAPILDRIQIIKIPASTLPISLTDFKAEVKEYGVKLNWQTAKEVNNQYFELLKADDSKEFEVLTQIKGAINSNAPKFYSFTDFNPANGTNYYQLKQVDLDGKSETFNPIAVKFGLSEDSFTILSTSTSSVSVSISLATATEGIISYLTIDGRILYKQNISVKSGLNIFNIPVDKSEGQIGIISFSAGGVQKSLKFSR